MGRKILLVTTDQQRYDTLGCNGGTLARTPVVDALAALGCTVEAETNAGMYVWATLPHDLDAMSVADELLKQGHLLAPGDLFSLSKRARSQMRFNVSRTLDSPALPALARAIEARKGGA